MYGFGGLGEVEVEIWSDVTMAGQRPTDRPNKKERYSYSAIRQWKAEMSNIDDFRIGTYQKYLGLTSVEYLFTP